MMSVCGHCEKEIPAGIGICPHCGRMQDRSNSYKQRMWLAVVLAVAVLIVWNYLVKPTPDGSVTAHPFSSLPSR